MAVEVDGDAQLGGLAASCPLASVHRVITMSGLSRPLVGGVILSVISLLLVAAAALLYLHGRSILTLSWSRYTLKQVEHDQGFMYASPLGHGYWSSRKGVSSASVLEDGHPLEPGNALHADIRGVGAGRFSFWDGAVLFSASDNSDPRHNGRSYEVRGPTPVPMAVVLLVWASMLIGLGWSFSFWLARDGLEGRRWRYPTLTTCLLLFLLAVAVRVGVYQIIQVQPARFSIGMRVMGLPFSDALGWDMQGDRLLHGEGMWPGWEARRPFYSIFLGVLYFWFGPSSQLAIGVNLLLSALTVPLVYLAVSKTADGLTGFVVALLVMFQFELLNSATLVTTETLGVFLTVLSVLSLLAGMDRQRGLWVFFAGVFFGLSNLTRPAILLALPVWVIVTAAVAWRRSDGRPGKSLNMALLLILGVVVTAGPWMVRQKITYGFWSISDNSSVALFAAASPKYGAWQPEVVQEAVNDGVERTIRAHYQYFMRRAVEQITAQPTVYARHVAASTYASLRYLVRMTVTGAGRVLVPVTILVAFLLYIRRVVSWAQLAAVTSVSVLWVLLACFGPVENLGLAAMAVGAVALIRRRPAHATVLLSTAVCTLIALGLLGGCVMDRINPLISWIAGGVFIAGWLGFFDCSLWAADRLLRRFGRGGLPPSVRLQAQSPGFPPDTRTRSRVTQRMIGSGALVAGLFFFIPCGVMLYRHTVKKPQPVVIGRPGVDEAAAIQQQFVARLPANSPLKELLDDGRANSLHVTRARILRVVWPLPANQDFVNHWSKHIARRSYDRTLFFAQLHNGMCLYGGDLPPGWTDREVLLIGVVSHKVQGVGPAYQSPLLEVVGLVSCQPGSNQPDWSNALIGSHEDHIKLVAQLITLSS